MESIGLCLGAFVAVFWFTRRSLVAGLSAALAVGYMYGIVRANVPQSFSHFLFDAALGGLYLGLWLKGLTPLQRQRTRKVRRWLILLIGWPALLFLIPVQDPLIQLVGLRGEIWFIPFLLIGALIDDEERSRLALWLAVLNLVALGFALAEFRLGVERFFPHNEVTKLIYTQNDVAQGQFSLFRIPATFVQQAAYSGTMVLTMPLLAGAWIQTGWTRSQKALWSAGIIAAMLGVFLGASRTQALLLFAEIAAFAGYAGLGRVRLKQLVAFAAIASLVGYWVYSNPRLQRFTNLKTNYVKERIHGSVNESFLDALWKYPLGNGLGGGGTSIPYFLEERLRNPVAIENEYARILLEVGIPGLLLWIAFIMSAIGGAQSDRAGPWTVGWRLARVTVVLYFGTAFIGTGLLTAIPGTGLLLLMTGWLCVPKLKPRVRPRFRRHGRGPRPVDGVRTLDPRNASSLPSGMGAGGWWLPPRRRDGPM